MQRPSETRQDRPIHSTQANKATTPLPARKYGQELVSAQKMLAAAVRRNQPGQSIGKLTKLMVKPDDDGGATATCLLCWRGLDDSVDPDRVARLIEQCLDQAVWNDLPSIRASYVQAGEDVAQHGHTFKIRIDW